MAKTSKILGSHIWHYFRQFGIRHETGLNFEVELDIPDPGEIEDRIDRALEMAKMGCFDGDHHKAWAIDQIVRALTGDGYDEWVRQYEQGEDGPKTYTWKVGIAP